MAQKLDSVLVQLSGTNTRNEAFDEVHRIGRRATHVLSHRFVLGDAKPVSLPESVPKALPSDLNLTERVSLAAAQLRSTVEDQKGRRSRRKKRTWDQEQAFSPDALDRSVRVAVTKPRPLSEYMIGKVAYAVIFVNGPGNRSFTEDEMIKPTADIQEALSWYADLEPRAHLSWFPEIHAVPIDEPVDLASTDLEALEAVWRDPIMKIFGFQVGIDGVAAFAESLRKQLQTDWSFVAFFTKYPIGGRDGADAYAETPRIVMAVDHDEGFVASIKEVFAHEVGHIFGCLDEYVTSGCVCSEVSGYLDGPNGNCVTCNGAPASCVMLQEDLELCSFSRVQLGWRDSNGNGVLDPEDVEITFIATETDVLATPASVLAR